MPKPDISRLAVRFCRALGEDTGQRPRQWRGIDRIAARCRISAEQVDEVAAYAAGSGWLLNMGRRSVWLTEAGASSSQAANS